MKKPTLLFDGNCPFCQYCAAYFKTRTNGAIQLVPFQEQSFGIPLSECQKSIWLIEGEHQKTSGAAAAFKALSFGENNRGWWCYQNVPGFAWITEKIYLHISHHRSAYFKLAKVICGNPWQVGRLSLIFWALLLIGALGLIWVG